jgi:hypothetical protein
MPAIPRQQEDDIEIDVKVKRSNASKLLQMT